MTRISVSEADGWAGIVRALEAAQSGDVVVIGPGRYEGADTLCVPSGVLMEGEDGHKLVYSGSTVAIEVEGTADIVLRGLNLFGYEGLDHADDGDPDDEIGLICTVRSRNVTVESCTVVSAARRRSALSFIGSESCIVQNCTVSGAQRGIALWSSSAAIRSNLCSQNLHGIMLARDRDSPDAPSRAMPRANRCHDNKLAGILLASSESKAVEDNECWANEEQGIVLARDPMSPDAPSRAVLRANGCHDNKAEGIGLFSSESEAVEDNECWANEGSGIAMQRDSNSPDAPSRAVLRANRCHDNKAAGIVLVSSESEAVENNECWANEEQGIALQRDPDSPDAPSRAVLRANRCHDNKAAGIGLASSESEAVEDNECWANEEQGIVLQRASESPDAPSRAVLRANRCHDNKSAGILLFSSESEAVEDNECWANEEQGIALARDPDSPDAPSRAMLRANRCQDNDNIGILFVGSTGHSEGNRFKGNGVNGSEFEPYRGSPVFVEEPVRIGDQTDPSLDLAAHVEPDLQAALSAAYQAPASDNAWSPIGLAEFLFSGCDGCFHAFWTGHRRSEDAAPSPEARTDPRHWTVVPDPAKPIQKRETLKPQGVVADILASIERQARNTVSSRPAAVHWAGLISPDETACDTIGQRLSNKSLEQADIGWVEGGRLRRPVTIEMRPRPLKDLLTDALKEGRKPWADRIEALIRSRLVLALLGFLAAALVLSWSFGRAVLDQSSRFLEEHGDSIEYGLGQLGLRSDGTWSLLTAGAWVLGFVVVTLLAINLVLPRHLRLFDAIVRDKTPAWLKPLTRIGSHLLRGKPTQWADKADRKWQARRLFGEHGEVVPLILRDIIGWRTGDLVWLENLAAETPEGHRLIVLMQANGRLLMRGLFIDPPDCPWTEGLDLYLDDDETRLALVKPETARERSATEQHMAIYGSLQLTELQGILGDVSEDPWAPCDLLLGLPIASAPAYRSLTTRRVSTNSGIGDDLRPDFEAASALFTGHQGLGHVTDKAVDMLFNLPNEAQAIGVGERGEGYRTYKVLTGRTSRRNQVAQIVYDIWNKGTDWEEYALSALRFGIWQRCRSVAQAIENGLAQRADVLEALVQLEAARFLGKESQRLTKSGCPIHGQSVFEDAQQRLASAIETLPDAPDCSLLVLRYLAVEAVCSPTEQRLQEAVMQRIAAILNDMALPELGTKLSSAMERFCVDTAREVITLRTMEQPARLRRIDQRLASDWRGMPDHLLALVKTLAETSHTRPLASILAEAEDLSALERLVRLHAIEPERTIYALGYAALRHAHHQAHWKPGEARPTEELAQIGSVLAGLHFSFFQKAGPLSREFAKGAAGYVDKAQVVFDVFSRPDATELLRDWLTMNEDQQLDEFEYQLDKELSDLYTNRTIQ